MRTSTIFKEEIMKKLTIILSAILCLCLLAGCGQAAAPAATEAPADGTGTAEPTVEEKSFELKIAGIKSDEDPASLAMQFFADEVNNNSDTLKVKVYTNSVLGTTNDLLSGMTDGTVDMFYNTLSCYAWVSGAECFNAISAPFMWDDNAELEAFLETAEVQAWFESAANDSGVRCVMAAGELPPRELTSNRPVACAADFSGLKIRTAESALVQETMKKLGAQPTVVPFADLYMALRQGTVDAQENGFMTVKSASLYEVQDYLMKTDYIRDVSAIFMGNDLWKQLSDNQKAVITAAAEKAVRFEEATIAEQIDEVVAFLKDKMTYVEIDVNSIQEALGEDFYDQFDGDLWPAGTMDVIKAFKNA